MGNLFFPFHINIFLRHLWPKIKKMNNLIVLGFLGGLGAPEIIVILIIILLLFGGKKIPELMRGLGRGVKEFKDAAKGETKDNDENK